MIELEFHEISQEKLIEMVRTKQEQCNSYIDTINKYMILLEAIVRQSGDMLRVPERTIELSRGELTCFYDESTKEYVYCIWEKYRTMLEK